jgi:Uma2 family endonuclease
MITVMIDESECTIPDSIENKSDFLDWMHSDEAPESGRFWWLQGKVWADTNMEEIFSHVAVKTEYTSVLHGIVKREKSGHYLTDGVLIANDDADISGEPDGLFVSNESIEAGLVQFIEGSRDGYTLLQGSPDMTLEIVSRGSVRKDTVNLREAYWVAGVKEYWLVDARKALSFDILRYTPRGYRSVRKDDEGWMKSSVFGKSFRLVQTKTAQGYPEYTLEVR